VELLSRRSTLHCGAVMAPLSSCVITFALFGTSSAAVGAEETQALIFDDECDSDTLCALELLQRSQQKVFKGDALRQPQDGWTAPGAPVPDVLESEGVPAPGKKCSVMPWAGGGIPVDKSLPPLPQYLALKHVQKAGGSFMAMTLLAMTEHLPLYFPRYRGFFRMIEEQINVASVARTEEENRDLFVISSVRNPCDWYVSLWAYTSQWDPQLNQMVSGRMGNDPMPFYDELHSDKQNNIARQTNTTKFASWMNWTQGLWDEPGSPGVSDKGAGLMTTRYWESFASGEDSGCYFSSDPRGACPGSCLATERNTFPSEGWADGVADPEVQALSTPPPLQLRQTSAEEATSGCGNCYDSTMNDKFIKHVADKPEIETDMNAWQPDDNVDCWVRDENMMDDFKLCLQEYERNSGVSLNWEPFYNPPAAPETNISPREKCEYYYTPELEDIVLTLDRHLFEKFGYDTCCGPSSSLSGSSL